MKLLQKGTENRWLYIAKASALASGNCGEGEGAWQRQTTPHSQHKNNSLRLAGIVFFSQILSLLRVFFILYCALGLTRDSSKMTGPMFSIAIYTAIFGLPAGGPTARA